MVGRDGLEGWAGVGVRALTRRFQMSWQILSGANYRVYLLFYPGCFNFALIDARATRHSTPLSVAHLTPKILQHLFKTLFTECHWQLLKRPM